MKDKEEKATEAERVKEEKERKKALRLKVKTTNLQLPGDEKIEGNSGCNTSKVIDYTNLSALPRASENNTPSSVQNKKISSPTPESPLMKKLKSNLSNKNSSIQRK